MNMQSSHLRAKLVVRLKALERIDIDHVRTNVKTAGGMYNSNITSYIIYIIIIYKCYQY